MMIKTTWIALSLLFVLLGSGCQQTSAIKGETAKHKTAVVPQSLQSEYDQFKFAPAMRVGDMLYLSGVVASMKEADDGNMTPAIARAFDDIELILKEAGASWSNVVDVTSYMTDLDNQIGPLWAVKEQRVPAPYPAWTAIGIKNLYPGPEAIIEIKVVAYLPN